MDKKISFNFKQLILNLRKFIENSKRRFLEEISTGTYVAKESCEDNVDPRLVVYADPKSHVAEQYRIMRTNIKSLSPDKNVKSIVFTSSLRGEGKTLTSSNISFSFSQEPDKKVILVDADLRRPGVHKIFGIEKEPGLSEILTGQEDIKKFIQSPRFKGLYIIPSGATPPNPSELLGSKKMKEILEVLKENFDYIFFDTAPIIPVTDAGVLGSLCDGVILLVKAGFTGALDVERAYSLIKEAGATPLGAILTGVVNYIPYYLYRYRYIYVHKY